MSEYTGKYDVLRAGASVGRVEITKSGLLTVFDCRCECDCREILRLCAARGGEFIPLGVMMPEGSALRLRKSFTKNALDSMGFTAAGGFYLVGANDEQEPAVQAMEQLVPEPEPEPESAPIPEPVPEPEQKPAPKPPQGDAASRWREIKDPAALFADIDIAEACRTVKGAFVLEQGETRMLAVPVSPNEPFPMMPIFCFGESETINGRNYIVFKIKNGKLTV